MRIKTLTCLLGIPRRVRRYFNGGVEQFDGCHVIITRRELSCNINLLSSCHARQLTNDNRKGIDSLMMLTVGTQYA